VRNYAATLGAGAYIRSVQICAAASQSFANQHTNPNTAHALIDIIDPGTPRRFIDESQRSYPIRPRAVRLRGVRAKHHRQHRRRDPRPRRRRNPGANVRATNTGTRAVFRTTTNSEGQYAIRTIPVGLYDLAVEAAGFKRFETTAIRVQVDELARVDAELSVGASTESVTVVGEVVTVDTESATLKSVVDQRRIEQLPLNGRNATQLMRLIVGVVADPRADVTSGTTYPGITPVSVNGSRANSTNYILDGSNNNRPLQQRPQPHADPDALQEFSVQTNNFSAEFGRQSAGS